MKVLIAIPAAGASRRMRGRDKLLEDVEGQPLLRRQAKAAMATGHSVLVLLPADDAGRSDALEGLDVMTETVEHARTGMSASLKCAALRASGFDGLAILLPDVPGVTDREISTVLKAYEDAFARDDQPRVTRATDPNGRPGTPIVFPPRLFARFVALRGDEGGRRLIGDENVLAIRFPDDRATKDLDTPEAWEAWRKGR